uniref:Uncharacterized protein n=1 Tax=Utricularia reniformis TaxID=192314 RepID=A0A1Y0B4F5_9LAMI|nr:hypothetical protein AEK19_MT2126 [Utricularia reniformis]ART32278.1 hypothetical protein AEK19_MT2126 [Utricularia reniformis]
MPFYRLFLLFPGRQLFPPCLCEQLFSSRSYLVCRFYLSADSHLTLTCAFGGKGLAPGSNAIKYLFAQYFQLVMFCA